MLSIFDVEQIVKRILGTTQAPIAALQDGTIQSDGHRVLNFQGSGVEVSDDPSNRRVNIFIPGAPAATTTSTFVSTAGVEKTFPLASFGATPPTNWQTTGFSDAGWAASVAESNSEAAFFVVVPTSAWITDTTRNGDLGSSVAAEELVRRTFALPAGTITGATLDINIDDDLQLSSPFINGNALTIPARTGSPRNYATVTIPIGWLVAGANNVLAIAISSAAGLMAVCYRITVTYASAGADSRYQLVSEKGAANGYCELDSGGLVPSDDLATGTPSGTTFLRGDQTWAPASTNSVAVKELDGTPNVAAVTIEFPNGTLTDHGSGVVEYTPAGPGTEPYVNVQDQKAAPSDGGTFTAGAWQQRTLNTIASDTGSIASLASNQLTLPAGTYRCSISAPAGGVASHAIRLRNITDSVTLLRGSTEFAQQATMTVNNRSVLSGMFTLSGSKALEVDHYCSTTRATYGMGVGSTSGGTLDGSSDVYTIAEFWKVS